MSKIEQEMVTHLAAIPLELERVRTELKTGLQLSVAGNRLTGARYVPAGLAGRALAWGGTGRLVGWSVRATGGPVTITLRDSRDASGEIIAAIAIPADTSKDFACPGGGVSFTEGLNVSSAGAGVLEGAFWLGAVD